VTSRASRRPENQSAPECRLRFGDGKIAERWGSSDGLRDSWGNSLGGRSDSRARVGGSTSLKTEDLQNVWVARRVVLFLDVLGEPYDEL